MTHLLLGIIDVSFLYSINKALCHLYLLNEIHNRKQSTANKMHLLELNQLPNGSLLFSSCNLPIFEQIFLENTWYCVCMKEWHCKSFYSACRETPQLAKMYLVPVVIMWQRVSSSLWCIASNSNIWKKTLKNSKTAIKDIRKLNPLSPDWFCCRITGNHHIIITTKASRWSPIIYTGIISTQNIVPRRWFTGLEETGIRDRKERRSCTCLWLGKETKGMQNCKSASL